MILGIFMAIIIALAALLGARQLVVVLMVIGITISIIAATIGPFGMGLLNFLSATL